MISFIICAVIITACGSHICRSISRDVRAIAADQRATTEWLAAIEETVSGPRSTPDIAIEGVDVVDVEAGYWVPRGVAVSSGVAFREVGS